MKIAPKRLALAVAGASLLALYGCGGGGGDPVAAGPSTMTVTPSLGQFSAGTVVELRKLDGSLGLVATNTVAANGSTVLTWTGYSGPVVVKVVGAPGVTFYDEGTNASASFGLGQVLSAVMAAPQAQVGVTPLTNAAFVKLGANPTTTEINTANAQVAAVFNLPSILQAPTAVAAIGSNLDIAKAADQYALVLAALAKTAIAGKNAADVAKDLAEDLRDSKLDGQYLATATSTPIVLASYTPSTLVAKYDEAANVYATSDSAASITPTSLVVTTTSVANVTVQTNQSAIDQAKTMFTELRTTLNSFANNSKTGFLDVQAQSMSTDLQGSVGSDLSKLMRRIQQIGMATSAFEDALAYTSSAPNGFVTGLTIGTTSPPILVRTNGSLADVWFGRNNFESCSTDSTTPSAITKIQCVEATVDGADYATNRIKAMVYVLTKTGSNQYSYTATRYNKAVTSLSPLTFSATNTLVVTDAVGNPVPVGTGTISKTLSGTTLTALAINGTLPPSASGTLPNTVATGVDTIALTATRTTTSANNYRMALAGSVSANKLLPTVGAGVDATKQLSLSFDTGSFMDWDETNIATTNGVKPTAFKLIGTVKTLASKFTGTADFTNFVTDAGGINYFPSKTSLIGTLTDTSGSTTSAGQFFTGKVEMLATNVGQYAPTAVESATNFLKATISLSGTVQAPNRPAMTIALGMVKSNYLGVSMTLNYTYGTTTITGSGSKDGVNSANDTMTLSNQDGIQVVTSTGKVTKSGDDLATIVGSQVNYKDGTTQSLN